MCPFVLEQINLGELLTQKHDYKSQDYQHTKKSDTSFSWANVTQTFKVI